MEGVAAGRHLLEIIGVLTSETDVEAAARILLERLLEVTGAQRGFVVVREADGYVDVFNVAFDRAAVSTEERRFSRRLVRVAAESREPLYSASAATDPVRRPAARGLERHYRAGTPRERDRIRARIADRDAGGAPVGQVTEMHAAARTLTVAARGACPHAHAQASKAAVELAR